MRIRITLDGYVTMFNAFFAEYDEDYYGVLFFTLDDDRLLVMMTLNEWAMNSCFLLENGYVDLIKYSAIFLDTKPGI